jgi:uncharacterized protein YecE (DUF72 family)
MENPRIGTCSWKYPSWEGLVYSKGVRNYLAEYARKFPTVEIDQWFWSLFPGAEPKLPDLGTVREYAESVPDDFRFTIKAPNSVTLTHPYPAGRKQSAAPNFWFLSAELARGFLALLEPLQSRTAAVIFQFEYLNRGKMKSQREFEDRLAAFGEELPAGFRYAVEIRNPGYLNEAFFDFLLARQWCPVLLQGYWMPAIAEVWREHSGRIRAFDRVILRLHGPDRAGIERETGKVWNRIIASQESELADIAGIVKDLIGSGNEIYVNINNHYEGSAPLTIERFLRFLRA